jgi:N4-gp56 family major capsid protein
VFKVADWTFTTSDALTAQTWASKWWREAKVESYFYGNGFIGLDQNNSLIVEFPDLMENQGYQHTFGQVRDLSGSGVSGDNDMEGNEEEPNVYDDAITLDQKRNAIRTAGKLSDQYPSDKAVRMWAKDLLKQWKAATIDQDLFTALGTSPTKVIYGGDATSTADIESGDYMTLQLVSKAVTYAAKATPMIKGMMVKGKESFACVMAPDQGFDLSERDASWAQAQREAMRRGPDNPIFHRALGIHKDCALHTHKRVAITTAWGSGSNLNGATALFMGVQSAGIAYAKKKVWNEKTFDYGNKVGFCIGAIYGTTKAVFNSADNAVVAIRTFRTSN